MKKRILALPLAISILLASCGGGTSATTMHLRKTEGTVGVSDDGGKALAPREDLGLYSGYGVDTSSESYAWIDLDDVKLVKMDEDSEITITKEGKNLEIDMVSGNLFFNVTEPLADDESMNIRTSTMIVGIRGTCGWVEVLDPEHMNLYLLEGTVECTAGEHTATVNAGEMAEMSTDGKIVISSLYQERIPAFVSEENLGEAILAEVASLYPLTVLTRQTVYRNDGELAMIYDFIYDDEGYILREESHSYYSDRKGEVHDSQGVTTYSYDGEGHCLCTDSHGSTYDWICEPGNTGASSAIHNDDIYSYIIMDPLINGTYDIRSEIGLDGRLHLDDWPEGLYTIYTMDENGFPVYIETYAPDGVLNRTATLEWTVINP